MCISTPLRIGVIHVSANWRIFIWQWAMNPSAKSRRYAMLNERDACLRNTFYRSSLTQSACPSHWSCLRKTTIQLDFTISYSLLPWGQQMPSNSMTTTVKFLGLKRNSLNLLLHCRCLTWGDLNGSVWKMSFQARLSQVWVLWRVWRSWVWQDFQAWIWGDWHSCAQNRFMRKPTHAQTIHIHYRALKQLN